MYQRFNLIAQWVARGLALAGGVVLLIIIALTVLSIIGRALVPLDLGIRSIRGIYDLTEIGMAAAVFGFLPLAQLHDAHARVDLFEPVFPAAMNRLLDLLFHGGMLVLAIVGTWRLYLGMLDKIRFGETTLIAQIPLWQGYAAGLVGACGFVLVAAFCVLRAARRVAGFDQKELHP